MPSGPQFAPPAFFRQIYLELLILVHLGYVGLRGVACLGQTPLLQSPVLLDVAGGLH